MQMCSAQPGLFDQGPPVDDNQVAFARKRMRGMIDRLSGTSIPPWREEINVILDDGTFRRAMWLVPAEEAQALWAEFDGHMERLYAIWRKANPVTAIS